jgi:hypothetical protein
VRITVHIERLVVDRELGLDGHQAAALRDAVAAELTRALGARPEWVPQAARTLSAGPLRLPSPAAPGSAGRAIADALCTGLTPRQARP